MSHCADLLANNERWSQEREALEPGVFLRQSREHSPRLLWIGCVDSRVPPEQLTGLGPGEMLVHRNVANLVGEKDSSCFAVVTFAVDHLKVRDILVVGHSGCGGVGAALHDQGDGALKEWLAPVRALRDLRSAELEPLPPEERADCLSEISVRQQWHQLAGSRPVQQAWQRGQPLALHACFYDLTTGRLRVLESRTA